MRANRTRKLKKLTFARSLGLTKGEMRQILDQLPDDFRLVGCSEDWNNDQWAMVIESATFPEIAECERLPELVISFNSSPAVPAKTFPRGKPLPVRCSCGADYTGCKHSDWCDLT